MKRMTAADYQALQETLTRLESKLDKLLSNQLDAVTYNPEEVCKMLDYRAETWQNYGDRNRDGFGQVKPKIWFTARDIVDMLHVAGYLVKQIGEQIQF